MCIINLTTCLFLENSGNGNLLFSTEESPFKSWPKYEVEFPGLLSHLRERERTLWQMRKRISPTVSQALSSTWSQGKSKGAKVSSLTSNWNLKRFPWGVMNLQNCFSVLLRVWKFPINTVFKNTVWLPQLFVKIRVFFFFSIFWASVGTCFCFLSYSEIEKCVYWDETQCLLQNWGEISVNLLNEKK